MVSLFCYRTEGPGPVRVMSMTISEFRHYLHPREEGRKPPRVDEKAFVEPHGFPAVALFY